MSKDKISSSLFFTDSEETVHCLCLGPNNLFVSTIDQFRNTRLRFSSSGEQRFALLHLTVRNSYCRFHFDFVQLERNDPNELSFSWNAAAAWSEIRLISPEKQQQVHTLAQVHHLIFHPPCQVTESLPLSGPERWMFMVVMIPDSLWPLSSQHTQL